MDRFVLVTGLAGVLFALYRRERRLGIVVALLILFLGFSFGFGPFYSLLPFKWGLKAERFIVPLRIVWFMLAGYGFSQVVELLMKLGFKTRVSRHAYGPGWRTPVTTLLCAGLILAYPTFSAYRYVDANRITALTLYDDPQLPSLTKVWAWLSASVPEGTRIDWPHFIRGVLYHFIGSVMFAGRPTDFFWNPETTSLVFDYLHPVYDGVWFPLFAQDADPTRFNMTDVYVRLRTVGVGVLVTEVPSIKAALVMYPRLFERVHDVDDFSIFYLRDPELGYVKVLDGQVTGVEGVKVEPEQVQFVVRGCGPKTELLVKMSYFPNWKAFVNGRETAVRVDDSTGLMRLTLEEAGDANVRLVYVSLWFEQTGAALTVLSLVGLVLVLAPKHLGDRMTRKVRAFFH